MRQRIVGFSAALVVAGALAACRSVTHGGRNELLPPPLPAGAAVFSDEEIRLARDLYVAKCAKCHRFYHPADYSETEWTSWMKKMSRKSKLKPDEEELLSRYLEAFRLAEPPSTTLLCRSGTTAAKVTLIGWIIGAKKREWTSERLDNCW